MTRNNVLKLGTPLLILLIVIITVMFNVFKGNSQSDNQNSVIATQNFICDGIKGFVFQYPVFRGWEVLTTKSEVTNGKVECFISLHSSLGTPTRIIVTKQTYSKQDFEIPAAAVSSPNPNSVPYIYTKEELSGGDYAPSHYGYVGFYGKDFKFWVSLDGISEKSGFPTEEFFNKVIETFKITGDNQ